MREMYSYDLSDPKWLAQMTTMVERLDQALAPLRLGEKEGLVGHIDEVALMLHEDHDYENVARALVRAGCQLNAVASDNVDVWPFGANYDVEYSFFQVPTQKLPLRIELMRIMEGTSPLHAVYEDFGAKFHSLGVPAVPVVHYSFKCWTPDAYQRITEGLKFTGAVMAQGCNSTYGRFSYWVYTGLTGRHMTYLKPRLNLRDSRQDPDATTVFPTSPAPQFRGLNVSDAEIRGLAGTEGEQ